MIKNFYMLILITFELYSDIQVRECLLSFGAESVVFQVAIQKLKH